MEPQYDATDMDNFYLGEENRALRAQRDELLTALKTIVQDYELLLGDGITDSTAPPLLKDAHAAIARVEGK